MHENTEGRRKKHYNWVWVQSACHIISEKIKADYPECEEAFTAVVAFPRGGLVPAVILSHLLGINKVITTDELSTEIKKRQNNSFLVPRDEQNYGVFLIVDDIADTGATFAEYLETHRQETDNNQLLFVTASLCYRTGTVFTPDYTVQDIQDTWAVFPWEETTSFT